MTNNSLECVVFDLDGTLTMSHDSIYKTTLKTLSEFNIEAKFTYEDFLDKIGLHFQDIFDDFGMNVPDVENFINVYKSLYFDFIDATKLYPGVESLLQNLKADDYKIVLLTTKGQDQAEKIINHFNLSGYFNFIMGRRPGMAHKPSAEPLQFICDQLNVAVDKTLMIGDSEMDIRCGKNAGSKTCAVTFGYRTKEALAAENPDFIIEHFNEFINIVNHK